MKPEFRPSIIELLEQKKWWWAVGSDEPIKVKRMTPQHRTNLLRWLRRNAAKLQSSYCRQLESISGMLSGEMALDDLDREIDRIELMDVDQWLVSLPFVNRLRELVEADEHEERRAWVGQGVPPTRVAHYQHHGRWRVYWGFGHGMRAEVKLTDKDGLFPVLYVYIFHTQDWVGVDLIDADGIVYKRAIRSTLLG